MKRPEDIRDFAAGMLVSNICCVLLLIELKKLLSTVFLCIAHITSKLYINICLLMDIPSAGRLTYSVMHSLPENYRM